MWTPPRFLRSSVAESSIWGVVNLLIFGSAHRLSIRASRWAPRRSFSYRFSRCSYSHGPSRLGVQKPNKKQCKQICPKLRLVGFLQKCSVRGNSFFLLFKFVIFKGVKTWLFYYSQLNFNEKLRVQKSYRKSGIRYGSVII